MKYDWLPYFAVGIYIGTTATILGIHFNSFAVGFAYFVLVSYLAEIWNSVKKRN
jgi:hypothetical protein